MPAEPIRSLATGVVLFGLQLKYKSTQQTYSLYTVYIISLVMCDLLHFPNLFTVSFDI